MRGKFRKVSIARRLIVDLMHASADVPFITLRRNLDIRALLEARALVDRPPGWAAIFVRAFMLVAREQPVLRTLYMKWPWPYFYELPRSVPVVAVARVQDGEDCVIPQKMTLSENEETLAHIDRLIRHAKEAPVEEVPSFQKLMRASALPLPLRRLVWMFGLNVGRQRANYFGSFGVTSVSAYGAGELHALSPGPYIVTYGVVEANQTIDVVIRWDHRVTDAARIAKTLTRLEEVLNTEIAAELRAIAGGTGATTVRATAN